MFVVDERSNLAWFDPASAQELYKFELVGLLVALAAYNGHHIAISFPSVLYYKLLGHPLFKEHAMGHLRDGWPDLHQNFRHMLDYDGDVEQVFSASYAFSFQEWGQQKEVNIAGIGRDDLKSFRDILAQQNGDAEVPPITNANRQEFVQDYVFWLTDKAIQPQYEAFAKGFYACFGKDILRTVGPSALRVIVEGFQEIDIVKLQEITTYEGYDKDDATIEEFWAIVHEFDYTHRKRLLEFVTGTSRIPVNGIERMSFKIIRNGTREVVHILSHLGDLNRRPVLTRCRERYCRLLGHASTRCSFPITRLANCWKRSWE